MTPAGPPGREKTAQDLVAGRSGAAPFSACRAALATFDFPIAITFPSEPIDGELDLIPQLAADEEIHNERQPRHQPQDQVAEPNVEG